MRTIVAAGVLTSLLLLPSFAGAFHLYRNTDGGCSPAEGEVTDDPLDGLGNPIHGEIVATVDLLHNTFNDEATLLPLVRIKAGEAVEWKWASSHCHSVDGRSNSPSFYSGFHYPTTPPDSPQVLPGFLEYPIPDPDPKLRYVHTFFTPGTYLYICEHHVEIGMIGVVIVDP
jgi:plastocyanin